ncbi:MAG: hypothetical protein MJ087_06975 [Lachnospiraceae bacterium]|nr:hypothetical protein [Lachnospiraceae bacterium]
MFFGQVDRTFENLRERSVEQWLEEIDGHEDLVVRGGVKVTREYIADLKKQIENLKRSNALKDQFLKQMKQKSLEK